MGTKRSRRPSARLLLVLINLLSIGALIWTLRDARLSDFKEDLASMDWRWVVLAVLANLGVYLLYAIRWSLVLRPVLRIGFWQMVRAVFVGLFGNELLPFKAGEILRTYLLSVRTELPFSVSLASVLIERIFDGMWLCLALFVTLHTVHFPHRFQYLVDGEWVLCGTVLGGAVLLAIAMFRRHWQAPPFGAASGWRRHLNILLEDLGLIGHSRYLYLAFLQTLPPLLLQTIPVWAAFKGYLLDLSILDAFALAIILRAIASLPQAPANIGLFQLLTREVLIRVFGVFPADASRFSVVLWGVMTLPLILGGLIAVWVEEADVIELRRAAKHHAAVLRARRHPFHSGLNPKS
ncbi:MAG TPA: lysylphosphatidylglycerol synthase transmembrane domain-containing protein [Bryobacteraceae bacterium]|nr:lysylphosphatidylglycerol synthase transmembrane domain-containing protein [Bryobacteraceae bacterium]